MSTLNGEPALATGAGRGVGRGIALALAGEGATVAVADRAEDTPGDTCAEIERRGGKTIPQLTALSARALTRRALSRTRPPHHPRPY